MEQENLSTQPEGDSSIVYIIGAIIIVAVIVAGVLLWPKPKAKEEAVTSVVEEKQVITKLGCDTQWYNPKIGFPEYYLSAEGTALSTTKSVDCTFTITGNLDGKVLATEKIPAILTSAAERGGQTFRCTTTAIPLPKGTVVTMKTTVADDLESGATCKAGSMLLP